MRALPFYNYIYTMKKIVCFILFVLMLSASNVTVVSAQCAMCAISADQGTKHGNTQAKGINSGVIYLMVIPYILIAGLGVLWYKKYYTPRAQRAQYSPENPDALHSQSSPGSSHFS